MVTLMGVPSSAHRFTDTLSTSRSTFPGYSLTLRDSRSSTCARTGTCF
jgi:hypothetical protein